MGQNLLSWPLALGAPVWLGSVCSSSPAPGDRDQGGEEQQVGMSPRVLVPGLCPGCRTCSGGAGSSSCN